MRLKLLSFTLYVSQADLAIIFILSFFAFKIGKDRTLGGDPCSLSWFSKGEYLVLSGSDMSCNLHTKDGIKLGQVTEQKSWIWAASVKPDSNFVVSNTCRLWYLFGLTDCHFPHFEWSETHNSSPASRNGRFYLFFYKFILGCWLSGRHDCCVSHDLRRCTRFVQRSLRVQRQHDWRHHPTPHHRPQRFRNHHYHMLWNLTQVC